MDETDFTALIDEHKKLLHKVARTYASTEADRGDLVQEIAVNLWRSRERYDARFPLTTWVYRIALNVAISHARREGRRRDRPQESPEELVEVADTEEPEDERVARLRACIGELGELDRALVLLHLEGADHATIADVLGTTATNVGTKLARVRATLRSAFERREREEDRSWKRTS